MGVGAAVMKVSPLLVAKRVQGLISRATADFEGDG